jgi:16S rRNA (cytidine1402-2'-O)-methyltransferase
VSGELAVVSTPIGNLGDVTARAVAVLTSADRILCEDTRRTRILLSALGIPGAGRLVSLHEHNEDGRIASVVAEVGGGAQVALVCDAGTPGISDPGQRLIAAATEAGVCVTAVPGPSALLAALVVSGLPTDRFCMEGFVPRKGRERDAALAALAAEERTSVLYEAPGRLGALLSSMAEVMDPERRVCVCRELTKLHEEVWRGTLAEAAERWSDAEVRGEIVVVLAGAVPDVAAEVDDETVLAHLAGSLASGLSRRDAARAAADELGVPRRRAYEAASGLG